MHRSRSRLRSWTLSSFQLLDIRYPLRYRSWESLIKSHRGRCGKNGPRARRLGASIPAAGCKHQAYTAPGRLSPQPEGLKPFVDFCLAVSRRARPSDCFAGYDAAPAARRCGVARSGETAAGIAQHSRLQKSANALQRPSWDLISGSLGIPEGAPLRNSRRLWNQLVRQRFAGALRQARSSRVDCFPGFSQKGQSLGHDGFVKSRGVGNSLLVLFRRNDNQIKWQEMTLAGHIPPSIADLHTLTEG